MSDFLIFIVTIITIMLVRRALQSDPEILDLQEKLENIKLIDFCIEDINGLWYLWMVHEHEGYSFVGQSDDKEELTKRGIEFVKKRYGIAVD